MGQVLVGWGGRWGWVGLLMGVVGCGAPVAVGPAAPIGTVAVTPGVVAVKGFGEGRVGEFVSLRFGLKVPLPDGGGWRIDDHGGSWLVAKHGGAASELVVRVWREEAVMNRGRCEERARFGRKIPEREGVDSVEKRAVDVPRDFDTVVEVGVTAPALGGKKGGEEELRGVALAFGGKGKRCFAWIYTTSAKGAGAEAVVGERLAMMVQGSLGAITTVNELDPQIERALGR